MLMGNRFLRCVDYGWRGQLKDARGVAKGIFEFALVVVVTIWVAFSAYYLFEEYLQDYKDRIIDTNWEHYDYRHVVFEPERLSPECLQAGTDWVIRKFYSPLRILKRLFRWFFVPLGIKNLIYPLGLNIAYFGRVCSFDIRGYNPALKQGWMTVVRKMFGKNSGLFEKVGLAAKM